MAHSPDTPILLTGVVLDGSEAPPLGDHPATRRRGGPPLLLDPPFAPRRHAAREEGPARGAQRAPRQPAVEEELALAPAPALREPLAGRGRGKGGRGEPFGPSERALGPPEAGPVPVGGGRRGVREVVVVGRVDVDRT